MKLKGGRPRDIELERLVQKYLGKLGKSLSYRDAAPLFSKELGREVHVTSIFRVAKRLSTAHG